MRWQDKTALVTGASSGIGNALALELARRGAAVVLCARRLDRLEETARRIRADGGRALAIACDVTREDQLEAAVARALHELGRLDVVVANAGFGVVGRIDELTADDFRRQFDTNVFGVLHTVRAALPALRSSRGSIAIVGSVSGWISAPGTAPYSMSKFAVRALAAALHLEMRPHGVAVTLVSPGFIESEIRRTDNLGRHHAEAPDTVPQWLVMPAATAARKIVRAIGRRRREVVVTFHGKLLVWLDRKMPWLLRFLMSRSVRRPSEPSPSRGGS